MYTYKKVFVSALSLVVLGLFLGAAESGQGRWDGSDEYPFRPESERDAMRAKKSSYQKFQDQEGIPVHTGFYADVYEVPLEPWRRQGPGIEGAYIDLEGASAVVNALCLQIPPGSQTNPERHLFEEQILILSGEGETHIWQKDQARKEVIYWRTGTVFSPPLNTWHQHFNKGSEPARLAAVTDLPLKIDIFRNTDFIFNNDFDFTDRYAGQANYFEPENSVDFGPSKGSHSMSIVNLIRDAWTWRLFHAGQGWKDVDRHFVLSGNTMTGHVEQFPVGTYERAHRHGPSSTIVLLTGTGYSLMWHTSLGITPWKDGKGDEIKRVDWRKGIMVIPPVQWYHQHFNNGMEPARFIKLGGTPGNMLSRITTRILEGGDRHMILWREEEPQVRKQFEKELSEHGARIQMPPHDQLIKMEEEEEEDRDDPAIAP